MADIRPEVELLRTKIRRSTVPYELAQKADRLLDRISALEQVSSYSMQELEIISKYVDWATRIPFRRYTTDNLELDNARGIMNKNHYGLTPIKENILEFIATQALKLRKMQQSNQPQPVELTAVQNPPVQMSEQPAAVNQPSPETGPVRVAHPLAQTITNAPILCFVGVQGVGKTTMAKSIAESLGRKFERIALGAFASVHEIRGRSKGETAAEPGQVVKALIKAGTMNPVILLDEIDKVSTASGLKADIMAALLEILDPEQNKEFTDRYIDHPIDLSQVIFITTANNLSGISAALLDRLEVVRFSSYTDQEKQMIAREYLLPKIRQDTGLNKDELDFSEDVWPLVIRPLGFDPGIRQLERNLMQLARKVAKMIIEGHAGKITITPDNFREFFPEQIAVMS